MSSYIEQTLEERKESCAKSVHVRKGETLRFHEHQGCISCCIKNTSVFIGSYFLQEYYDNEAKFNRTTRIKPNSGWHH